MNYSQIPLTFLDHPTRTAALIRSLDWQQTSLGMPDNWPAGLKVNLNTMMVSAFPMLLFWGEELICFYNEPLAANLPEEQLRGAMGKPGHLAWSANWNFLGPLVRETATLGKSTWVEDQEVPFYHNGKLSEVYWTFSCSPIYDDAGANAGALLIYKETTEKVSILKKLEDSGKLYSFAIDASELGTWDLNPVTNKFIANQRLKDWFGLMPEEEVELSVAINAMAERDRQRVSDAIARSVQYSSGGNYDIDYTIINRKTGQERLVRAKGKAAFDENHNAYRFNGTLQDITAEVAAREESQKLSVLVENSVDLMAIVTLDGRNSYLNNAGRQLLGIKPDEDPSQIPTEEFHTPDQLDYVMSEIIPQTLANGHWSGVFAVKNRETGEIIPLYNNSFRIDNARTGEPIGIGTVMRDIRSELNTRQKLEEQVRERTRELSRLNEELEKKNKELASFAFISSHDLQEPLRKINTFISRIEDGSNALSERNQEYFVKIKKSATRMQTLINDLLSFSRTSADKLHFEKTDLNAVISGVLRDYHDKLEAAGASVRQDRLPILPVVPFQVQQLFDNLIANAIKFARPDIALQIDVTYKLTIQKPADNAIVPLSFHQISVRDNGIGFSDEYREKIFEVFQRLHGRNAYEGTGIGLAICKKIMENHSGFISATGSPDEGATFELYFPV